MLGVPISASAQPRVGAPIPVLTAVDLADRPHSSSELIGRPTLLVVLTRREPIERTKTWLDEMGRRFPGDGIRVVTVITLDLFGLPTLTMVRHRVRASVAEQFWANTWLDAGGQMRHALDLQMRSLQPFIIVLDRNGRVVATVNGTLEDPRADAIWSALAAVR